MEMYQHDGRSSFRFVLRGELKGDQVQELEHAWIAAQSIVTRKELVVDVSGLTDMDGAGVDLLARFRESGARIITAQPAEERGDQRWALRVLRLTRLCE